MHQPASGCYATRKTTHVAMTMSLHHHSVHSSNKCSKSSVRTCQDRKMWDRARASPRPWTGGCCCHGLSMGRSTQGCWEAFNHLLLTLCGSAFSPGVSQTIPHPMSVATAMDSIQMGNPHHVRWQHPPPPAAPRGWQQAGEAYKGE